MSPGAGGAGEVTTYWGAEVLCNLLGAVVLCRGTYCGAEVVNTGIWGAGEGFDLGVAGGGWYTGVTCCISVNLQLERGLRFSQIVRGQM